MRKNKDKIDIILPNYNSSDYIIETIKSVIFQSYKNWRLLIVDDHSNNKTINILKKYSKNKRIDIFYLKKNKGAAYCRNLALKKSSSPYVAFIDSDDLWKKNKLKNQIEFMKKNNYNFTYTAYETFGSKKNYIIPPNKINFSEFIHNTSIATSTMIIKKNAIGKTKFSNTLICEDYFFKCKILTKVKYAYCLNKRLGKYRIRGNSLQSNNFRNLYWIWKINNKYNKLSFFLNLKSLLFISLNSLRKYGLKNIF
jgi:teichuronic acid biosynthesis glycosyltransferase TuaG